MYTVHNYVSRCRSFLKKINFKHYDNVEEGHVREMPHCMQLVYFNNGVVTLAFSHKCISHRHSYKTQ